MKNIHSAIAAAVIATFAVGATAAYAPDEGTPYNLVAAFTHQEGEGTPRDLIAQHRQDEGTPQNLVAMQQDEGTPQNLVAMADRTKGSAAEPGRLNARPLPRAAARTPERRHRFTSGRRFRIGPRFRCEIGHDGPALYQCRGAYAAVLPRPRLLASRLIPHRHRPRAELEPAHELQVERLR